MSEILKNVYSQFDLTQTVYLATADNNQPFVRPVTLIYFKKQFFIATSLSDTKMNQLKNNRKIEYCMPLVDKENMGYIRGLGEAECVNELSVKKEIFENVPYIKQFWDTPDHKEFALLELHLKYYEYLEAGEFLALKVKV